MQLLISVRSAEEVNAALEGGADIIDAKEPNQGSLGSVSGPVLSRICSRVPPRHQLSIAMGDVTAPSQVQAAIASLPAERRSAPVYLKLGFAGVSSVGEIGTLIAAAAAIARSHVLQPRLIAVAYADAEAADSAAPEEIIGVAAGAGGAGVLLDTWRKDGRNLFDWIQPSRLLMCLTSARRAGLTTAVAGSLGADHVACLSRAGADVAGFRGAACIGGRGGGVSRARVQVLRNAIDRAASASLQGRFSYSA